MKKYTISRLLCAVMTVILFGTIFLPSEAFGAEENTKAAAVELSKEEQEFIEKKKEIVIGCPVGNCPLIFEDEKTGEIKGITIDILNMMSESINMPFRYQALPSGNVTYQELVELQVDIVASMECNDINRHAHGVVMTEPYLQTEKVFVCKKGVLFNPDGNMVVAVASGSPTLEKVILGQYPNFQVDYYDATDDALNALLSGKADTVLQNQYSVERILSKPKYETLQIVAAASIGDMQCLGALVPISEDGQNIISEETACLLSILNKSIAVLDKSAVSFHVIKETAENSYKLTAVDILYRYRYAAVVIVISILVIIVLLRKNYALQKKQMEQTAAEKRAKELAVINEQMHEQQILLEDALKHAESGSRAKSSFLFNMSHDMRTPMNAILGFTDIAYHNRENTEKLTDSLQKIQESGKHLLQLINQILDMARMESGNVTLTEDVCNLVDTVEKCTTVFQSEMDKKRLTVKIDVANVEHKWVYCDSMRVNQILFNLLSNAIKFSREDGAVSITLCQLKSNMNDYATYELHIKDNGIGMSKEFQERIFDSFERERTSTVSKTQGTGLGMSITKNLIDLMGGTISVQSELNKGTEFTLRFTFKKHEAMEQVKEEETVDESSLCTVFAGKRLLLVEDNELNMEIAKEILTADGFLIETAENGKIAVDMVQNSAPGYYDAILMDIQMPVMDGYEATQAIRALESKALSSIPITALTANAFDEDKRKALTSGMNAHIAKPIDLHALHKTLEKILKK